MSSINDILEIGLQGLNANRKALETTSQNIANANTPGYSKQKAVLQTGDSKIGGGVVVTKILREHDAFTQKHLLEETRQFGALKSTSESSKRLEAVVYENGGQVNEAISRFLNARKELEAHPESEAMRVTVIDAAEDAARSFRHLSGSLDSLRAEIDERIKSSATTVESMKAEAHFLENKIRETEASGQSSNELLDKRDEIARQLSVHEGELTGLVVARKSTLESSRVAVDRAALQFAGSVEGEDGALFHVPPQEEGEGVKPLGAAHVIHLVDDIRENPELINPVETELDPEVTRQSLTALLNRVGTRAYTDERGLEHQEAICDQLENYRQSLTGVSIEEESVRMMQHQAAMNAAAKAIKVGDELMQTILALKA